MSPPAHVRVLMLAALLVSAVSCGTGTPPAAGVPAEYPATRFEDLVEEIHGVPVADPFRWLEDGEDPEVQAWLASQDALTQRVLSEVPGREAVRARLAELAYYDAVSPPQRRGERFFYRKRHADKEKSVHYWREGLEGAERVLLDPNVMSDDGTISIGVVVPDESGARVAYSVRRNNADAATLHVMDVETGAVSEVDVIEGAKYAYPQWTPDGDGFYYNWLPADPSIPVDRLPGEARIRYHALGRAPETDPVVYGPTNDPTRFLSVDLSEDGRWLLVYERLGWVSTDVYVRDLERGAPFEPLAVGLQAQIDLEVHDGSFYALTNLDAPRRRVVRIDPRAPARASWIELVPESPDATIDDGGMRIFGGRLVVSYVKRATSELKVFTLAGEPVRDVELPVPGTIGSLAGRPEDDEAFFSLSSFTEPPRVLSMTLSGGELRDWSISKIDFDPSLLVTQQVSYVSADGTEVTMFLVHRSDVEPVGGVPVLLYGYGGFNVSLTPSFSPWILPWIERGGLYAVANLRGGSEYGEKWHRDGMLGRKQNVFDDFIAAAEWLVESGWTRPERLAIHGRSNGGLLVGAVMTQRPELFGAVVCGVPLLDMVRYHLFGSGRTWISEYGTAEDPEQFAYIHAYSPYHRVERGVAYPALLMLTTDSDDRVDPMHARKFVAATQAAAGSPRRSGLQLLRLERNAGHGGADLIAAQLDEWSDIYAFLDGELGLE